MKIEKGVNCVLQKIQVGDIEEELLSIVLVNRSVYIETFHYKYEIEAGDFIVAKEIYKRLMDIYITFRFKNTTVKMDLYEILSSLHPYKFVCTESKKYSYVLQVATDNGIFTVIKCYTDGTYIYLILDSYTYSHIALQPLDDYSRNNPQQVVNTIDRAARESKVMTIDATGTMSIYTNMGVHQYKVMSTLHTK